MGVKILSLFDGMACGMIAMQLAGVEVESYDAYEIDKYAIKTAQHNFPMIKEHGDVFDADFTQYEGVDFLIGGSPCTYWSIAQTKNRETVASGMGWELFSQYVRALHEAKPKYFIYENNKSMSKQIRASIDEAFGFEAVLINSALVSAQNRQRLYWVGRRDEDGTYSKVNVEQPADRGILLKDVLDSAVAMREKAHAVIASAGRTTEREFFVKNQGNMAAEPINVTEDGKSQTLKAQYCKNNVANFCCYSSTYGASGVAEPINATADGKAQCLRATCYKDGIRNIVANEVDKKTGVAEPINVESYEISHTCDFNVTPSGTLRVAYTDKSESQGYRVYCADYKSVAMRAQGNGRGAELVAEPISYCTDKNMEHLMRNFGSKGKIVDEESKTPTLMAAAGMGGGNHIYYADLFAEPINMTIEFDDDGKPIKAIGKDGKEITIYEVKDGKITIKGKQYPIKLKDGYYIIRKLTVSECKRLQTVPEWYEFPVSNSQAYKMLGNGWTCEVIAHLIRACVGGE